MANLDDYSAFVAVVDRGNLTAASRSLGRSLQAVSRSLARVERELGVVLVQRTTRQAVPTPAGLAFHARMKAVLSEIELARTEVEQHGEVVSGTLRITASVLFGPAFVVPVAANFMRRWPGVRVEMILSDGFSDLVKEGLDLAVRIGDLPNSSLRARILGRTRLVTFAAPSYLTAHGAPATPQDLAGHNCIVRTTGPEGDTWPFSVDGNVIRVPVSGNFRSGHAAACNEAVAAGLGIGIAPLWQVRRLADEGRVELILTAFEPPPVAVSAVWAPGVAMPARTRLFLDTMVAHFASERW